MFDGLLPLKKEPVRIERLEASVKQTHMYSLLKRTSLTVSELAKVKTPLEITSAMLFQDHFSSSRSSNALPAVPFLVPSVLDALAVSRFAKVARVVAGEADAFCALAAFEKGCLVLTGDSDLLVHDLGVGAVVFLTDMNLQQEDYIENLSAKVFRPQQIARRLKIDSISRLAYELSEHAPLPLGEALRRARQDLEENDWVGHHMFAREYETACIVEHEVVCHAKSGVEPTFLDPRVSEFVLQSLDVNRKVLNVYLPVLIEDPSRHSAWLISVGIRRLAYSLLLKSGTCVNEYAREGLRIVPEQIDAWDFQQVQQFATQVSDQVRWATTTFRNMTQSSIWTTLCIAKIIAWYLKSERILPSVHAVKSILKGKSGDFASDIAFLWNQVQGYMYSFRMLQQILSHMLLKFPESLTKPVERLSLDIASFPKLGVLLASPLKEAQRQDTKKQIDLILQFAAPEQSIQQKAALQEWADLKQRKGRTQKEKAKGSSDNRKAQIEMSNNRYGLLANV